FPSLCRMAATPYPAHLPLLQRKHRASRGFPLHLLSPPNPHNDTFVYCLNTAESLKLKAMQITYCGDN
ncbi:hypothetical protein, partial [Klebsiella quasipneumoniae]|uniref:hypothetical protein n=1 Tax=Klebsiella quasipneumoniae TaxID=1463165 RepID=UPI001E4977FF